MDFSLSDRQLRLRQSTIEFCRETINPALPSETAGPNIDRELWLACGTHGLFGLGMPEEFSGSDAEDFQTCVAALEGLGYACKENGFPFAVTAQSWTVQQSVLLHGNVDQKARYLPRFCSGELIGAHAMTEPEVGSDSAQMQTHAQPCEGGYRLTGNKCMISLAPVADTIVLFATVRPGSGRWGITAFLVDRQSAGLHVSEPTDKMGLRSVPMGEVILDNCFVPEANRLGPEGAGAAIANHALEIERIGILASQVGRMERQLEIAIEHARTREQSGHPIGHFQSVSNRVADMKLRYELSRLLLYKVAWQKDQGQSAMLEAALLKLQISEAFLESGIDNLRLHGGHGYLTATGVEHDVRDALGGILYAGTSDIQRNIVAGLLGVS